MVLSKEARQQKLAALAKDFGFAGTEELIEAAFKDSVTPGICIRPDCTYTTDVEPDQTEGRCDLCCSGTVQSALVLAGLI